MARCGTERGSAGAGEDDQAGSGRGAGAGAGATAGAPDWAAPDWAAAAWAAPTWAALAWAAPDWAAAAASSARPADLARPAAFRAFLGRAPGGCRCHTRTDTKTSSFSAKGAIRHQIRGSDRYRSCELTSSGSRLFSMTGRVVSQVSTPGGST